MALFDKSKDMVPTLLSIAGSDPTGGAGIQADLKTMTCLGGCAAAIPTCITVQNSHGVSMISPLSPELVQAQLVAVLTDHWVSHIKIGMIGSLEISQMLADALSAFQGEVILDPVLAATTGQPLVQGVPGEAMSREAVNAVILTILPQVTILTPNLLELAQLSQMPRGSEGAEALSTAKTLMTRYPNLRAVILKGGHQQTGQQLTDYLVMRKTTGGYQIMTHQHPRLTNSNSHGTGCTLASAFTVFHQLKADDAWAFQAAVDYLQNLLRQGADLSIVRNPVGQGGVPHWLGHLTQ